MKKIWIFVIIVLFIGGFIGLYVGFIQRPAANGVASSASVNSSPAAAKLSSSMRQLWEERNAWTRLYIIDLASNNGFADVDLARLMKNQEEIGNAVKPYYGNAAGNRVTTFLQQDISEMAAFAQAVNTQNTSEKNKADIKWSANAKQITDFLIKTDPNFENSDLQLQIQPYLIQTKQEIMDIFAKKYQASVTDFDHLQQQTLQLADAFSSSIRQQFPEKF